MAKPKRSRESLKSWKEIYPKEPISVEKLQEFLLGLFKERESDTERPWKGIKHYVWEENGEQYSMWDINGTRTGDAGYELFCNAVREQAKNYGKINNPDEYYSRAV